MTMLILYSISGLSSPVQENLYEVVAPSSGAMFGSFAHDQLLVRGDIEVVFSLLVLPEPPDVLTGSGQCLQSLTE